NTLNKSMGRLRGDKKLDDAARAQRALQAVHAIHAGDYALAATLLEGQGDAPALPDADPATALDQLTDALRAMGDQVDALNAQIREVEAQLEAHMLWLPNLPHDSVPVGASDAENIPHAAQGTQRTYTFTPKPHWELGPALDIIDFERGVKIAGSRGYVLKGWGARLQRALISLFLDMAREKGFQEVYVPYFVKEPMLYGAGQFPKFRDVVYHDPDADIYLLPTAEVAVTNLYRDEILDEALLPLNLVAHTPCFRREKTSAGRDVRGIKRVHQFEKVEMYQLTTPETSYAALETLTDAAGDICQALGLPYRRLEIVTGDLGFSASKKYDIEVWSPGCAEWLEVSSCSNTESFQARRANLKYRPANGKKAQFVHTLNGSGLATPRVLIAILETYQRADGSVEIPAVLRPYLGGAEVVTR
ncbi:MAG: serine--tRNA ligase, partial [Armatimonadetes bacterium]|nr:serine--tRNA ligase [Anaerolineae bacterium]